MIEAQIVCRDTRGSQTSDTLRSWISSALFPLELSDRVEAKPGHCLVRVYRTDPVHDILFACREVSYAYLRVIAWERGGSTEKTGDAQCVSGLEGQPLTPISMRVSSDQANSRHALFRSRDGLVVARMLFNGSSFEVMVDEHRIQHHMVAPPASVFEGSFTDPSQLIAAVESVAVKYAPLVRATVRKVECTFCTHVHYMDVEDCTNED